MISGRADGMRSSLWKKEELVFFEGQLRACIDNMSSGAAAHIDQLQIIVAVIRQGNKSWLL